MSDSIDFHYTFEETELDKRVSYDQIIKSLIVKGESYTSVHQFMKQWQDFIDNNNYHPESEILPIWFRPSVYSKKNGRKGTRKGWKKKNPPRWMHLNLRTGIDWMGHVYLYEGKKPRLPIMLTFTEKISPEYASIMKSWSKELQNI